MAFQASPAPRRQHHAASSTPPVARRQTRQRAAAVIPLGSGAASALFLRESSHRMRSFNTSNLKHVLLLGGSRLQRVGERLLANTLQRRHPTLPPAVTPPRLPAVIAGPFAPCNHPQRCCLTPPSPLPSHLPTATNWRWALPGRASLLSGSRGS